jgi:predicted enzyme related to lactoylglutathione lyase
VRFWAEALGWTVDRNGDEISLQPDDGTRFNILLEPSPEPKVGQNRIHLDLTTTSVDDQQRTVTKLIEIGALSLGATQVDIGQGNVSWVVLADPDDNEFCVLSPQ